MAGTRRSPELIASLEARARTMRVEGYRMAEISRALDVPTSTLHQWAAQRGWQLDDIAAAIPLRAAEPAPADADAVNLVDETAEPPTALEAAQAVLQLAAIEGMRGRLGRSDQAAKLARQLFLLAEQAQKVEAAEAALHPKEYKLSEAEVEELRESLRERLFRKDAPQPQAYDPPASPEPEPAPSPAPAPASEPEPPRRRREQPATPSIRRL